MVIAERAMDEDTAPLGRRVNHFAMSYDRFVAGPIEDYLFPDWLQHSQSIETEKCHQI